MGEEVFNELIVVKRSGQRVSFNGTKIAIAIKHAFDSIYETYNEQDVNRVYEEVLKDIEINYKGRKTINVEDIQDIIEKTLKLEKFMDVYKAFNNYRLKRAASREVFNVKQQHKFVKAIEKIGLKVKSDKTETPLEEILNFGKIISNEFSKAYLLESKYIRAHEEGIIYIHDINYYTLGITAASLLDFSNFKVNDYNSDIEEITDIIINIKKEQFGEQIIPALDFILAKYVLNSFKRRFKQNLGKYLSLNNFINYINMKQVESMIDKIKTLDFEMSLFASFINGNYVLDIFNKAYSDSLMEQKDELKHQFIKMLNKFKKLDFGINNNKVSISLGTNTSCCGRLIIESYLEALDLLPKTSNVKTIFKVNKNINLYPKTFNYNYLENVIKLLCADKNISLTFDEAEYFSEGEKIIDSNQNQLGRIILSTTTINLARLGLKYSKKDRCLFYKELEEVMELTKNQLLQRYEVQANKYRENFKYLFENNLLVDADKLEYNQKVRKVLRNGTLNIGFIGLTECILALLDDEKIAKPKVIDLGFEILTFMNNKIKDFILESKLNFSLIEIYDKKILKELKAIDKSIYGTKKTNNQDIYESFNNLYKNLSLNEQLSLNSKYQMLVSSKIVISIKNLSCKKIMDILNNMARLGIKYGKIKIE